MCRRPHNKPPAAQSLSRGPRLSTGFETSAMNDCLQIIGSANPTASVVLNGNAAHHGAS
jgi:hypothetical protein